MRDSRNSFHQFASVSETSICVGCDSLMPNWLDKMLERIMTWARRGTSIGAWHIDADDIGHVTPILLFNDRQMSITPLFAVMEAKRRLARFAETGHRGRMAHRCAFPPGTGALLAADHRHSLRIN